MLDITGVIVDKWCVVNRHIDLIFDFFFFKTGLQINISNYTLYKSLVILFPVKYIVVT